ncbi:hypothetical protein BGX31_001987 [Mortierella sp. GBA43]|nr:hypothetical protein BGX31_001987 [Mortierella sp. GBA43]
MEHEWLEQAFKSLTTGKVVYIKVSRDPKDNSLIIPWSAILRSFPTAEYVKAGEFRVPFRVNDRSEQFIPARIQYHHGKVLDIVEPNIVQDTDGFDKETSTQDTASSKDPTLGDVGSGAQSSLYAQIKDQESILENMVSKQGIQGPSAWSFRETLASLQKDAELATSKDETIQNHFTDISLHVRDLDPPLPGRYYQLLMLIQAGEVSNQQRMILEAQQERIDELVEFQDTVEELAALAFGAQDRPVPRLFIVLPKNLALSKDQEQLSCDDFRLYFLCECYLESADQEDQAAGNSSAKIHLADHQGYELEKAQEFFEDYGSYVQAILYILTNGITAPGIHVPSMAHVKLTEGVYEVRSSLDLATNTIESLIQRTVAFMERIPSRKETIDRESALDLLEHTDLQPLVQYLKNGSDLGGLCPRVMNSGGVQWVCAKHYHLQGHEPKVWELRENDLRKADGSLGVRKGDQLWDDRDQDVDPLGLREGDQLWDDSDQDVGPLGLGEGDQLWDDRDQDVNFPNKALYTNPFYDMTGQPEPVSTTWEQDSWYDPSGLYGTRTMRAEAVSASSKYRPPTARGASSVNVTPIGGSADIHQSAKSGDLPMVEDILSRDPNLINASSRTGLSVLSSACESPKPYELVAHLVERGARINDADMFYKRTALHVLCEKAGLSQDDWTIAYYEEKLDVLAAMRYLLEHGADVDAMNYKQETPLMCLLIGRDCPRMVQVLYSHGADSRLKSLEGERTHGTALCYAAYYDRIHSLEWMLENDLLSSDEENIKKAIQCATSSKAYPRAVHYGDNSRTEVIQMLEGWLGKAGVAKRARLANKISTHSMEDWWRRIASGVADNDDQDNDNDAGGIIGYPPRLRKTSRLAKSPPPLPPVRGIYKSSSTKMPLRMMPQGTLPQKKMPREMMPLGTMPQGVIPTKMTRMWHELQSLSRHLSQDRATDFDPAGEISPSQDNVWEIM